MDHEVAAATNVAVERNVEDDVAERTATITTTTAATTATVSTMTKQDDPESKQEQKDVDMVPEEPEQEPPPTDTTSTTSKKTSSSGFTVQNTKNKFKAVMTRAVQDTKKVTLLPNVLKQRPVPSTTTSTTATTTTSPKRTTTQTVTTAMHHVSDQIRTMKTNVQRKVNHHNHNINRNTNRSSPISPNVTLPDTSETSHYENDDTTTIPDENDTQTLLIPGSNTNTNTNTTPNSTNTKVFTVSPAMDFLTADATLMFIFTASAALYPLYEYWNVLFVPMNIANTTSAMTPLFVLTRIGVPWMIAAFTLGWAMGQYDADGWWSFFHPLLFTSTTPTPTTASVEVKDQMSDGKSVMPLDECDSRGLPQPVDNTTDTSLDSMTKKKHTLFMTLLGSNRSTRIQFRNSMTTNPASTTKVTQQLRQQPVKVWTTLTNRNHHHYHNKAENGDIVLDDTSTMSMNSTATSRKSRSGRLPWQRHITPTEDGYLMQHLLKHESFRRIIAVRKPSMTTSTATSSVLPDTVTTTSVDETDDTTSIPVNDGMIDSQQQRQQQQLGSFDLTGVVADTLEGYVVTPLFQLRGMDIYLSEDIPEMESSTHPYLLEHGLRSVPTFIVNVLTQWGNIFIYFEMPSWVEGFDMMVDESDPDDVKALKVGSTQFGINAWIFLLFHSPLLVFSTIIRLCTDVCISDS